MMKWNRFILPSLMAVGLPVVVACSEVTDATGALCCTDFKVGADMSGASFGLEGEAQGNFRAFAQASGDLSAAATATLDSITNACRAMAVDGGATNEEIATNDAAAPNDRVGLWCNLAVAKIQAHLTAKGSLKVNFQAPKCEASFSATAKCQGGCSATAGCDVKANPPKCTGKATLSCSAECKGTAEAPSIACEGGCTGTCEGSCTAEGGVAVDCQGKCEGECEAKAGAQNGGAQADGTCNGTCKGTCTASATAPKAECKGVCKGTCSATCKATPGKAEIKCDGQCEGGVAVSCSGGELKASCEVDAKCEANCSASASAKAECTPPALEITFDGALDVNASIMIDSLKVNLPAIVVAAKARGQAFIDLSGQLAGSASAVFDPGSLSVEGAACIPPVVAALVDSSAQIKVSIEASASVLTAAGGS